MADNLISISVHSHKKIAKAFFVMIANRNRFFLQLFSSLQYTAWWHHHRVYILTEGCCDEMEIYIKADFTPDDIIIVADR